MASNRSWQRSTQAARTTEVVNAPAQAAPSGASSKARSGLPDGFRPAAIPHAANPWGAVTPPDTNRQGDCMAQPRGLGPSSFGSMQRRIGLTGGIASGKSSVGRLLEARGWPVLDADQYAREALAPNTAAAKAVAEHFCGAVGDASALDRSALGQIVFNDADARRWLEALIHPVVRERFQQELEQAQPGTGGGADDSTAVRDRPGSALQRGVAGGLRAASTAGTLDARVA